MWRHVGSNALTFFIIFLFMLAGAVLWGKGQFSQPGPLAEAICLKVSPGSNMRRVANTLEDRGAVSSKSIFQMGADYTDKSGDLKAGNFLVPAAASMENILDIVTRGGQSTCGTEVVYRIGINRVLAEVRELDPATNRFQDVAEFQPSVDETPEIYTSVIAESDTRYRIALAEGVTSWQVVQALGTIDVLEGNTAGVPAEGSLAPDSYEVRVGDNRIELLSKMTSRQERILADAWLARSPDVPLETPEEALILASIIEKETGVASERGQVASVFVNRLNQGMRLQTDPTVIYGITKGEGVLGRGLRQSELRAQTPYNTYVIDGLPPTPIANPGRASILAALNPETTDYIFFVADGTGGHAFATTLDGHNRNVARWREIEAERANDSN